MPNNENLENTPLQEGGNTGEQQGNEPPVKSEVGIYQLLNGMWNKIDDNVSAASREAQAQYTTFKENNMDPVVEGWAIDHLQTSDLLKELTMMFGSDFYSTNHQNFVATGEGTERTYSYNGLTFDDRINSIQTQLNNSFTNEISTISPGQGDKGITSKAVATKFNDLYNVYTKASVTCTGSGGSATDAHILKIGNVLVIFNTLIFKTSSTKSEVTATFSYSDILNNFNLLGTNGYFDFSNSATNCSWIRDMANKTVMCQKNSTKTKKIASGKLVWVQFHVLSI